MARSLFKQAAWLALALVLQARAGTIYVATNGTSLSPFNSWDTAATNVHDAVALAGSGDTVWVSNGTYRLTNQVAITTNVTVQSVNGPDVTAIYRDSAFSNRMFVVSNSSALVAGFTISNAYVNIYGSGQAVELYGGKVSNCVVTRCNSYALGGLQANMVLITGGLFTHGVISSNQSRSRVVWVGGSGVLSDSTVAMNYTPYDPGSLYLTGGAIVRRCRIFGNN